MAQVLRALKSLLRLFTHPNVDLDAVCSVWAAQRFMGMQSATLVFAGPSELKGYSFGKRDVIVDLDLNNSPVTAIKGDYDGHGVRHSAFKAIMKRYAPDDVLEAMAAVIEFVDLLDTYGDVIGQLAPDVYGFEGKILRTNNLNNILYAIRRQVQSDEKTCEMMGLILDGMLSEQLERLNAAKEAEKAIWFNGTVALVENPSSAVQSELLAQGALAIVYMDRRSNSIGMKRSRRLEPHTMVQSEVIKVVEAAGERICEIGEDAVADGLWYRHPSDFFVGHGSQKNPKGRMSKVDHYELAQALANALARMQTEGVIS